MIFRLRLTSCAAHSRALGLDFYWVLLLALVITSLGAHESDFVRMGNVFVVRIFFSMTSPVIATSHILHWWFTILAADRVRNTTCGPWLSVFCFQRANSRSSHTSPPHQFHMRSGQGAKFQDVTRQHIVRTVIIMFRIRWWPTFHTSSHKRLASKMGSRELGNVGSKTCQLYWHKDSDESYQHCFTSSQHLARRCARSNLIGVKFN